MNEGRVYHTAPSRTERADYVTGEALEPWTDLLEYCREYTRQQPEVVALWCFGIGFILGWKLKPW